MANKKWNPQILTDTNHPRQNPPPQRRPFPNPPPPAAAHFHLNLDPSRHARLELERARYEDAVQDEIYRRSLWPGQALAMHERNMRDIINGGFAARFLEREEDGEEDREEEKEGRDE